MSPTIGMIVPPAGRQVPPEAPALYPDGVRFIAKGLGLKSLTPEGYDGVIDDVAIAARLLADDGADAVALMGTSLSFYRGAAFNDTLTNRMAEATGLPVTTMSTSIARALAAVGAKRVALGTAYVDVVNERLAGFLEAKGFDIAGLASLDIADVNRIAQVTEKDLLTLGERAFEAADRPDALFISCGGLRTLSVTRPLEDRMGVPVVSSSVAGVWGAMALIDHDGTVPGRGRLLTLTAA